MRNILSIFSIFLLCAAIVVVVGYNDVDDNGYSVYSYDTSFSPPAFYDSRDRARVPAKNVRPRIFKWIDPAKISRETVLDIPAKALKKEVGRFGTSHSMSNPFFLEKRGFKIVGKRHFVHNNKIHQRFVSIIDYKQIFQRNLAYFPPLTRTLSESAELPPRQDPLHSFLAFVQHIEYRLPPQRYRGRFINSFFIPLVLLDERYGDCDSKSLLLADFLCTTPIALAGARKGKGEKTAMVLIRGNGLSHALLAVKRKPLPGMTSLHDIKKGYFILLETTKPGWSPGFISRRATDAIKAGLFQFVELN